MVRDDVCQRMQRMAWRGKGWEVCVCVCVPLACALPLFHIPIARARFLKLGLGRVAYAKFHIFVCHACKGAGTDFTCQRMSTHVNACQRTHTSQRDARLQSIDPLTNARPHAHTHARTHARMWHAPSFSPLHACISHLTENGVVRFVVLPSDLCHHIRLHLGILWEALVVPWAEVKQKNLSLLPHAKVLGHVDCLENERERERE